ncbi:alpha/beta fold hydrolase [Pseudoalteromonas lipolytica]
MAVFVPNILANNFLPIIRALQAKGARAIKLILLPGMDGTGKLFEPILASLPSNLDAQVITLSSLQGNDIKSQAEEVARLIGKQEVIIFAESYSGSIAYELAQFESVNIKHIVFAASFLSRPSYFSKFGAITPLFILRLNLVPSFILSWLFFGSLKRNDQVKLFKQALKLVPNSTLKARLKIIASLTEPEKQIKVPCTYIQATKDKLVNPESITVFQRLCVNLKTERVIGGHFIAQSNPKKCAEVVSEASGL